MSKKISIVVPCYNEEETVKLFYEEFKKRTAEMDNEINFEILFVDDGSRDTTLEKIRSLKSELRYKVRYISFSRNFGKEAAILAGLKNATGDYVALMDVDLQDPPELISEMYQKIINEDYDCVATRREDRAGEPPVRSLFAKMFYKIINKFSETEIVDGARDFRLMKRCMVDSLLMLNEKNRFSKGLLSWVGYKTFWISYENVERSAGTTKWNFWKLFKYSIEGFLGFTVFPLVVASVLGGIGVFAGFIGLIVSLIETLVSFCPQILLLSSLVIFVGGLNLMCIGIMSLYVSKMYTEIKNRPVYIIKSMSA